MVIVVDDDRSYAEALCEEISNLFFGNSNKFDWESKEDGNVRCYTDFKRAEEEIVDKASEIQFLVVDIMIDLPEGDYAGQARVGGYVLLDKLKKLGLLTSMLRKIAIITHVTEIDIPKDLTLLKSELAINRIIKKRHTSAEDAAKIIYDWAVMENASSVK